MLARLSQTLRRFGNDQHRGQPRCTVYNHLFLPLALKGPFHLPPSLKNPLRQRQIAALVQSHLCVLQLWLQDEIRLRHSLSKCHLFMN